jgi:glycosyltransferase involved in cell wall biosynthesis
LNIAIVIFCYNEKDTIDKVIQSSIAVAAVLSDSYEIVVVDDGSTDGTREIIKQYPDVISIIHPTNLGIGPALRSGYAAASKDYICAIPGDGQFDVKELLKASPFPSNKIYSFYRTQTNYGPYRFMLTLLNKLFNKLFLSIDIKDINWIKIYRKNQLDFVDMKLTSSLVESEICAKLIKSGCTLIEQSSIYHERKGGVSTGGNWKTLSKAVKEMAVLYSEVHRFKKQLPI